MHILLYLLSVFLNPKNVIKFLAELSREYTPVNVDFLALKEILSINISFN